MNVFLTAFNLLKRASTDTSLHIFKTYLLCIVLLVIFYAILLFLMHLNYLSRLYIKAFFKWKKIYRGKMSFIHFIQN